MPQTKYQRQLKAPYIEIQGMQFYDEFGLDNGYMITYTKLGVQAQGFHRVCITTPGVLRLLKWLYTGEFGF